MNLEQTDLDALVHTFASDWLRLGEQQLALELVADPVLVLGPDGITPLPRAAFLDAVAARSRAVEESGETTTTLLAASAHPIGDRMVLATISWGFSLRGTTTTLVSEFVLQRSESHRLRCVAYLPRTNVVEHLEG